MLFNYRNRQLVMAALVTNALKPSKGRITSIPAFAIGWPTLEMAPQMLAIGLADTAQHLIRHRRRGDVSVVGVGAAMVATAALGYMIKQSHDTGALVQEGIADSLGPNYLEEVPDQEFSDPGSTPLQVMRPFNLVDKEVEIIKDVNYRIGGSRARLDIYRPKGVDLKNAPVLIQVHGGGWVIGDKGQQGLLLMSAMAKRGWICVSVNYRLAPKHPFPAQIIDVKRAIAWVKQNIAEYGGDPSYVVITGGSAGGHLSSLAAVTPNDPQYQPDFEDADTAVQACVPFYGVYDVGGIIGDSYSKGIRDDFFAPSVFQKDPKTDPEPFQQASPIFHVNGDEPDFLVIHGANDSLVQVSQARAFVAKLREKSKHSVTYLELPGTQHAFEVFGSIRSRHVIKAVERWLCWHQATHQGVQPAEATTA
jgi:acetyl esterase/lipase